MILIGLMMITLSIVAFLMFIPDEYQTKIIEPMERRRAEKIVAEAIIRASSK